MCIHHVFHYLTKIYHYITNRRFNYYNLSKVHRCVFPVLQGFHNLPLGVRCGRIVVFSSRLWSRKRVRRISGSGGITMKMFVSTVIIFTAELNYFLNCAFYSISDRLLKGNDANLLPQCKPLLWQTANKLRFYLQ
jgi:hypothetical protein